jgi:hypothetical protein
MLLLQNLKAIKAIITEWEQLQGREAKDLDILNILRQRVYDLEVHIFLFLFA